MNSKAHVDAIIAALNASGATANLADTFEKMTEKPSHYTEVHVMPGVAPTVRVGAPGGVQMVRVITRAVALSQVNAMRERDLAEQALTDAVLTVAGADPVRVSRELADDPIAPDDGWWSGTSSWVYAV